MKSIDRMLYALGIVRRSEYDSLRLAAENLLIECKEFIRLQNEPPQPFKPQVIEGGRK